MKIYIIKSSKLLKASKLGVKTAGKVAGPLALLGVGLDAYSNFSDDKLSSGDAALKTLDQNKFMALGAAIGSIVPGVGTIIGAGIGGLLDIVVPTIGDYGDANNEQLEEQRKTNDLLTKQTEQLNNQNKELYDAISAARSIELNGVNLANEGISTSKESFRIQ